LNTTTGSVLVYWIDRGVCDQMGLERRIVDVCDGDYVEVLVDVQTECGRCGDDITHSAHITWTPYGEVCLFCHHELMEEEFSKERKKDV